MNEQQDTKTSAEPKKSNFRCEEFMKFVPNAGPEMRQAMEIPIALEVHSKEIA